MTRYRLYWRESTEEWVLSSGGTPIRTSKRKKDLVPVGTSLADPGDSFRIETKRGTISKDFQNPVRN